MQIPVVPLILLLFSTAGAHASSAATLNSTLTSSTSCFKSSQAAKDLQGRAPGYLKATKPEFPDLEAKKILDAIGERGDRQHLLGVTGGPFAMDYTGAQLRTLVKRTFALASKYRIAVALHIDDSKFWLDRRDLWSNPANGMARLEWNSEHGSFSKLGQPLSLPHSLLLTTPR